MMNKFKGTPGPWVAKKIHGELKVIVMNSFEKLGPGMVSYIPVTDEIDNKHNAQLIAAAPELLEALRGVMSMFPVIDDDESGRMGFTEDARNKLNAANDAINKALGQ